MWLTLSNPAFEEHIVAVNQILEALRLDHIRKLIVFNKEDKVDSQLVKNVCERYQGISISAIQQQTLMKLILRVQEEILRLYPEGENIPQLNRQPTLACNERIETWNCSDRGTRCPQCDAVTRLKHHKKHLPIFLILDFLGSFS